MWTAWILFSRSTWDDEQKPWSDTICNRQQGPRLYGGYPLTARGGDTYHRVNRSLGVDGMKVSRDFEFDAAHRVLGHPGTCAYLHGHRYRLRVVVEAPDLNALGILIDFGDIKKIVEERLMRKWDHSALFRYDDPLVGAVLEAQPEAVERVITLPDNPTAEVMARTAFHEVAKALPEGVTLTEVTIWETPNCSASISANHL
jgi:6-pyruvoyltetrahydropterin/6-carboxytetrahydropterin synthase